MIQRLRMPGRAKGETERVPAGVVPAALAALAESGILFLPLEVLVRVSAIAGSGGPFGSLALFVPLFALSVAVATAGRRSRWFVPVVVGGAVATGMAQAAWWGAGTPAALALGAVLGVILAVRVVTLALRDWRDPIQGSFGWGAAALLVEIIVGGQEDWSGLLPVVVPLFFVGSLASRAMSLRLAEGVETLAATSRHWAGLAVGAVVVVGVLVAGAGLLGGQGGFLERIGRVIPLLIYWVLYGLTFLLAAVLKVVAWIGGVLGFHPASLARVIRRLGRAPAAVRGGLRDASSLEAVQRILGLVLLVGVTALLVWQIIRQRRRWTERAGQPDELVEPKHEPERPPRTVRSRAKRHRRELPEDTVRRWYAETLLALEGRGLARAPARTPGEFLRDTEMAFPGCAASFGALTRAYEDVRYGSRVIDARRLDRLEAHRGIVLTLLKESPPR